MSSSEVDFYLGVLNPRVTFLSVLFSIRPEVDLIVLYDLESKLLSPPSVDTPLRRLFDALYTNEKVAIPRRPPVVLEGGWLAWVNYIGSIGKLEDWIEILDGWGGIEEGGDPSNLKQNEKENIPTSSSIHGTSLESPSDHIPLSMLTGYNSSSNMSNRGDYARSPSEYVRSNNVLNL